MIGLIMMLQSTLPRNELLTTYEVFIKSQLDYGVIHYNQPSNSFFNKKLESIWYEAIKGPF